MDYKEVKRCRVCGSRKLRKYLDLGKLPLANCLLSSPKEKFKKYPLQVLFCEECSLSQLSIVVDPSILYSNYPYHSSVSSTFKRHCFEMAKSIKAMFTHPKTYDGWDGPQPNPSYGKPIENLIALDIASNDGCALEQFKANGFNVVGVEPSENLAREANLKGLRTHCEFWGEKELGWITPVDVITASNVLAHVDSVYHFLLFAKKKLRAYSNGFIVIEVPYLKNLIEDNQFDTIYHEHLSYFLLKPLVLLFDQCWFKVFKVEEHPIHGGSLRVFATPYEREADASVQAFLNLEEDLGLYSFKTYKDFSKQAERIKSDFLDALNFIKNQGKKVMGYGASAKGATLLNYCGVNSSHIQSIVDDTKEKQGKIIPGAGIPVVSGDNFDTNHPDYISIMAWNFSDELIRKTESHKLRGGKYIIPIPEVTIQ